MIVRQINRLKINPGTTAGKKTNPKNYRHHNPPYGYKIKNGKLVLNKAELKICRLVVEMVGRQSRSAREVARELEKRGLITRTGKTSWQYFTVSSIFKRWNDKL